MCDTKAFAIDHVICGGGTCTAQGPCVYEEVCPTLKAAGVHAVVYEWHGQAMRVKEIKDDVSPTLTAGMGMGG